MIEIWANGPTTEELQKALIEARRDLVVASVRQNESAGAYRAYDKAYAVVWKAKNAYESSKRGQPVNSGNKEVEVVDHPPPATSPETPK